MGLFGGAKGWETVISPLLLLVAVGFSGAANGPPSVSGSRSLAGRFGASQIQRYGKCPIEFGEFSGCQASDIIREHCLRKTYKLVTMNRTVVFQSLVDTHISPRFTR